MVSQLLPGFEFGSLPLATTVKHSAQASSQVIKRVPSTKPNHNQDTHANPQPKVPTKTKPASKVVISTSSRYQAYLASYKQKKLRENTTNSKIGKEEVDNNQVEMQNS